MLGRGAVIGAGQPIPPELTDAVHLVVDDAVAAEPRAAAELLHRCWTARVPVVVELAVGNDVLRSPETTEVAPHDLPRWFSFDRERLHRLMWANTWDLRSGTPVWWHGVKAQRLGVGAIPSDRADVELDGVHAWVDGGPRGPLPLPHVHAESVELQRGRDAPRLRVVQPADDGGSGDEALAPDQRAAVLHGSGPARIIAPAGSGKTRVLTARLRHLLGDREVERELVTAVAYNTRAAQEMRDRTRGLRATVRTLHAFAWRIVRSVEDREVVDERRVREVLQRFVTVPRVPNTDPWQPWLEALSDIRLGLRAPDEVEAERGDVDGLGEVFTRYREELARRRWIDFDEQVYRAIELLLADPDLRVRVQRQCTHLLVDEFQDLTPAFLLLVRLVASPWLQVFGVGDDDQTIYGHTGASPEFLIDYARYFPGAADHPLEVNYRCPPAVVAQAATLLGHNTRRVHKTIRAPEPVAADAAVDPAEGAQVHLVPVGAMAGRTLRLVEEALDGGAAPSDVAVLARVNAALLPLQVALGEAGVPRTAPIDRRVLERTGMRTALAYVRIALDPTSIRRRDVDETIRRPARKLSTASRDLLGRRSTLSYDELVGLLDQLDGHAHDRYADYLDDLRLLVRAAADGADLPRLLAIVRDRIGLGDAMESLDASRTRATGSSHSDDLDALEQLAALHPDPHDFEDWLRAALERPGDDVAVATEADAAAGIAGGPGGDHRRPDGPRRPAVTLSTIHRVKGMEWDHVVVFAASAGLFPHRLAEGTAEVEEERRVFHVAVTRARATLAVVGDAAAPSPFIRELRAGVRQRGPDADREVPAPPSAARFGKDRSGDVVVADRGLRVELPGGARGTVLGARDGEVELRVEVDGVAPYEVLLAEGTTVGVDGRRARLRRPTVARAPRAARVLDLAGNERPVSNADPAVVEALRTWRTQRAREDGMPPYVILHDRHIEAIAARAPGSLRELGRCPGIGPTKLDRYGDEILEVLAATG